MTPAPAAVMLPGRPPRPSRRRGVRASGPAGPAGDGGGAVERWQWRSERRSADSVVSAAVSAQVCKGLRSNERERPGFATLIY